VNSVIHISCHLWDWKYLKHGQAITPVQVEKFQYGGFDVEVYSWPLEKLIMTQMLNICAKFHKTRWLPYHQDGTVADDNELTVRARIVDFLWITISWQSPRRYRDIITIATSADDRQQTRDTQGMRSPIPARSKHQDRDNGILVKRWCQPCSHCGDEEPFARCAGDRDWNDAWPTSNSTGYVAADACHYCRGSGTPVAAPARLWCSRLP